MSDSTQIIQPSKGFLIRHRGRPDAGLPLQRRGAKGQRDRRPGPPRCALYILADSNRGLRTDMILEIEDVSSMRPQPSRTPPAARSRACRFIAALVGLN